MSAVSIDVRLAQAFLTAHPTEAALAVERLPEADLVRLVDELPTEVTAPVLERLNQGLAAAAVAELDPARAGEVVAAIDPRRVALLLRRLPAEAREAILDGVPRALAGRLREVLRYPAETAGALCDPSVLTVAADRTVAEAVEAARRASQAYYYVFVVDREQRLAGVVNLRRLLAADGAARVGTVARPDVARLPATAGAATILAHPSWRDLPALPVVDADDRFVGLLRHETVRRLEAESAGRPLGEAAAMLALGFGELVWSAGGAMVGELADALARPRQAEGGHDR